MFVHRLVAFKVALKVENVACLLQSVEAGITETLESDKISMDTLAKNCKTLRKHSIPTRVTENEMATKTERGRREPLLVVEIHSGFRV